MPKVLLDKLGNDGAEALAHVINESETKTRTELATKGDLTELKLSTKSDLAEAKSDLLKWMVLMWITQISAIALLFMKR